jgi:hypothetical protein
LLKCLIRPPCLGAEETERERALDKYETEKVARERRESDKEFSCLSQIQYK